MEFGELGIPIDSSRSCVLQLPTSVCWYIVYKYSLLHTKRLGQVFSYAANCICKQHIIDNTAGC